jgi:hypothetical protein
MRTVERNARTGDILKGHGYDKKYTKPMMNGYVPFRIAALDMVNPVRDFSTNILNKCKNAFLNDILKNVDPEEIKSMVHPYDIHTAINGAPGVAYVDRLKISTSAGNPWKCKKGKFFVSCDDGTDDYKMLPEMMERVQKVLETYRKQMRYHPVFCAHLKDEAVTFKKANIGKTRVFTGAPVDWSIVNRMFFLSCIRLIQNNKFAFEAGVGTVAQSMEWTGILQYLLRCEGKFVTEIEKHELIERFIAGDYKAFDKRMSPLFILKAFEILIDICVMSGNYTPEEINILWCLAYDTAFPTVDFNGDLIQFYGSNPSGHPLTVIINSLVNSLYIRYAYHELNPKKEVESFQNNVRLMTYGDDNVMTSKVNWFNHTAISEVLDKMGITYTMADKEAVSRPFIHLSEVSFLKRTWSWNEEIKAYLAPLDHESIEKMLMTWTRSKISEENQMMDIIKSACSEYFFYGKKTYNSKIKLFKEIVHEKDWDYLITPSSFPTWAEMKERFRNSSARIGIEMEEYDCYEDDEDFEVIDYPNQSYIQTLPADYTQVCSSVNVSFCYQKANYVMPERFCMYQKDVLVNGVLSTCFIYYGEFLFVCHMLYILFVMLFLIYTIIAFFFELSTFQKYFIVHFIFSILYIKYECFCMTYLCIAYCLHIIGRRIMSSF